MNTKYKDRTLTYKAADISHSPGGVDLQTLLNAAFTAMPRAIRRRQPTDMEGSSRLIVHRQTHVSMLCGVLSSYTEGAAAAVVDLDSEEDNLPIASLAASLNGSERAQFLEGLLYFGVFRNHVIVCQSMRQRAPSLESHINWLLRHAGVLTDEDKTLVYLADQPPPEMLGGVFRVKKLLLRAPLEVTYPDAHGTLPKGKPWDAILGFVGSGFGLRTDLRLPAALHTGKIKTELAVQWQSETPDDGTPLLDTMAHLLRRSDDIDYIIETQAGEKITKEQVRLTHGVRVLHHTEEEADMSSVFGHMVTWLDRLHGDGRILA